MDWFKIYALYDLQDNQLHQFLSLRLAATITTTYISTSAQTLVRLTKTDIYTTTSTTARGGN